MYMKMLFYRVSRKQIYDLVRPDCRNANLKANSSCSICCQNEASQFERIRRTRAISCETKMLLNQVRVLVVEDAPPDGSSVLGQLNTSPHANLEVKHATRFEKCIELLKQESFEVVLLEHGIPGVDTLDVLEVFVKAFPDLAIVLLINRQDSDFCLIALQKGAQDYLIKSEFHPTDLINSIRYALSRKKAESHIRNIKTYAEKIVEAVADPLVVLDDKLCVISANSAFYEAFPNTDGRIVSNCLIGQQDFQIDLPALNRELLNVLSGNETLKDFLLECTNCGEGRRYFLINAQRMPCSTDTDYVIVLTIKDMTKWRQLEDQYAHSQRLEAVGRLAAGVAHDFNNLLTVILGYCEIIAPGLENTTYADHIKTIRHSADRAVSLVGQLLAFSRKQVSRPTLFDINALVSQMAKMLSRLLQEDVKLVIKADPNLGQIHADYSQLESAILNLAVNARDAMPNGGQLLLETTNFQCEDPPPNDKSDMIPGNYSMISMTDSGEGIPEHVLPFIFEPFFTTKEQGKGTGLGLASVYGLVKQNHGYIYVRSQPGIGTTFELLFPHNDNEDCQSHGELNSTADLQGHETVLLVEDCEPVRTLVKSALNSYGFRVLEATNGIEAKKLFDSNVETIDILVSDIIMPEQSGYELAAQILAMKPQTQVLLVTGYSDEIVGDHGIDPTRYFLLQKPFTPLVLVRKVREILDAYECSKTANSQ